MGKTRGSCLVTAFLPLPMYVTGSFHGRVRNTTVCTGHSSGATPRSSTAAALAASAASATLVSLAALRFFNTGE